MTSRYLGHAYHKNLQRLQYIQSTAKGKDEECDKRRDGWMMWLQQQEHESHRHNAGYTWFKMLKSSEVQKLLEHA